MKPCSLTLQNIELSSSSCFQGKKTNQPGKKKCSRMYLTSAEPSDTGITGGCEGELQAPELEHCAQGCQVFESSSAPRSLQG